MPGPVASDLHVDTLLTNISVGYSNPDYIADKIFPMVPVQKQSDKLVEFDQSHWFRDTARLRARGTKSQGSGYGVTTTATYFCDRYSFRKEIADEDRDNADAVFNLDREAAEFVADKLQMRREVAFATDFFAASKWTTTKTGATDFTKWSDYGASTPLVDLATYQDTVEGLIGREPNCLVLGKQVWTQLRWHPDLIDLIKYTQRGVLGVDLFAALAQFPKVFVGKAIYTTTAEGTAEASVSYSRVWGKDALMLYVPDSPGLRTPAAGYTFVWRRVANALQYIKRMRDEERETDIIEGNSYFDQKQTAARAGLFMDEAVA